MLVNGEQIRLQKTMTLEQYLLENGYDKRKVAIERNGEIVPKRMYTECMLTDADTLEIVHFVGGG